MNSIEIKKINFTDIFLALFTLHFLYTGLFGPLSMEWHRAYFLGGSMIITFLINKTTFKFNKNIGVVVDYILIFVVIATMGYFIMNYYESIFLVGLSPKTGYIIMGLLSVLVLMESTRRNIGKVLPIITLVFIIYAIYGPLFPGLLSHKGVAFTKFVADIYMSMDGIFGSVTNTIASFVFPFVMFSTFFIEFGGGDFFINLANRILSKSSGGPAKAAVVSSFLMGMISGSQIGNVVATGSFTIPTMKKSGYPAHLAGGIEAASSLGGSIMPPIMGATAFLIAEFTGYSYLRIIKAAAIPGILYFLSVFLLVHFQAQKLGLKGFELSTQKLNEISSMLKRYWYLFIPIFVIVYLLIEGYSPRYAAVASIASLLLLTFFLGNRKDWLLRVWNGLVSSAKNIATIGSVVGLMGIIILSVNYTGLGLKFGAAMQIISGEILIIPIIFVFLICLVLGTGVSVSTSYIICAVVAIPPLLALDIKLLSAHLLIAWFAQSATVTPPVCLSAYAAASIAGADPLKTGYASLRFASGLFFIPLLFIYTDILFLETLNFINAIRLVLTCLFAVVAYCAFLQNWLLVKTSIMQRILLGLSAVALFNQNLTTDILGIALLALVFLVQYLKIYTKAVKKNTNQGGGVL